MTLKLFALIENKHNLILSVFVLFTILSCEPKEVPVPIIDSITPVKGYIGDPVILTGQNLNNPDKILFNQTESEYALGTKNSITILVPPGADIGLNKITIKNKGGDSNMFTYEVLEDNRVVDLAPPKIVSLYPASNFIKYPLLIYGENLSVAQVSFNEIISPIYTNNRNVVTTIIPDGLPSGVVKLKITTPKGESNIIDFTVSGSPPPGVPVVNFSIVSIPPPTYVPTISNNWSCGLYADQGNGRFIDLNSVDSDGNFSIEGYYEFKYDDQKKYNSLNFVQIVNKKTGETWAGQFSSEFGNPCVLKMILVSTLTGEVFVCDFDRRINGVDDCDT